MADTPEKLEPKAPPVSAAPKTGTETSRSAENTPIDEAAKEADLSRQEAAKEAAVKRIQDAFSQTQADSVADRVETSRDIAQEVLGNTFTKLVKEWEKRRESLYARAKKGEHMTYADLNASTSEIEKQMQDTAGILTAYIFEMAGKNGGKLSAEAIVEMKESMNRSALKMAQLAMKQKEAPELVDAFQFALNSKKVDKIKAFDSLSKIIFGKAELSSYAWTVLSFMNEKLQVEFGKFYIEKNKLNPADAQKFLETWNIQGNISLETMRTILENSRLPIDTTGFEAKAQEYARNWKAKNDFTQSAIDMAKKSYGATNQATDMMTPTGVFTFLGKVWGWGAIGLNTAVATFYGGKINNPEFIVKSLLQNPWFLAGAGTVAAIKAKEEVGSVGEALKSKEERQAEEKLAAKKELKYLVAENLEIEAFVKGGDYAGAQKFYDYLTYVRSKKENKEEPLNEKDVTKVEFLKWIRSSLAKATPANQDKLMDAQTAAQKAKITDEQFYKLAGLVEKLGIGGLAAENNYIKAIA